MPLAANGRSYKLREYEGLRNFAQYLVQVRGYNPRTISVRRWRSSTTAKDGGRFAPHSNTRTLPFPLLVVVLGWWKELQQVMPLNLLAFTAHLVADKHPLKIECVDTWGMPCALPGGALQRALCNKIYIAGSKLVVGTTEGVLLVYDVKEKSDSAGMWCHDTMCLLIFFRKRQSCLSLLCQQPWVPNLQGVHKKENPNPTAQYCWQAKHNDQLVRYSMLIVHWKLTYLRRWSDKRSWSPIFQFPLYCT